MNMTLWNKLFKKKASHYFTYESDPLFGKKKLIEVFERYKKSACNTQHKPLVCYFEIRNVKDTRRKKDIETIWKQCKE